MPTFSKASKDILSKAHPDLQRLFNEVIKEYDCTITCSHRGQDEQEKAFRDGFSKARWLQSPHNYTPALAVDAVPYPTMWKDNRKLNELGAIVKIKAIDLGIDIEWGGDWRFLDLPHYELSDWQKLK
jgi:peptidoglycan L-alanyl-D-glutamate endopeptidase CwlK